MTTEAHNSAHITITLHGAELDCFLKRLMTSLYEVFADYSHAEVDEMFEKGLFEHAYCMNCDDFLIRLNNTN